MTEQSGGIQEFDTLSQMSIKDLHQMKREIEENLRQIEQQIYNLEGNYLEETGNFGNVVKGFEGYLSTRARASHSTRKTKFKDSDRIFSNSSYSLYPAVASSTDGAEGLLGGGVAGSVGGSSSMSSNIDDDHHHRGASSSHSTAKSRRNVGTMTIGQTAAQPTTSLTGNVIYVDDSSNPLRREVALSEENKELVFQTNERKRKMPASKQTIQKRRRRKAVSKPLPAQPSDVNQNDEDENDDEEETNHDQ